VNSRRCIGIFVATLLLASALFLSGRQLNAQGITTGTVNGTVTDQQNAVVSNAEVVAIDQATGGRFQTKSAEQGVFSLRNLPSGTYSITITAASFNPLHMENVTVTAGGLVSLGNEVLSIGSAATTVQVSDEAAAILETQQAQVQSSFGTVELPTLPLNGLLDNVMEFIPGVVKAHDLSFSNSNGDDYSVNGQRSRSNNFEIDGQSNNDNSVGGSQFFFGNQDAIKEVQIISSNLNAQYGRNMGAIVNYVTKNGTNAFHGSGFEYYTGSFLSSLSNDQKSPLFGYCLPGQNASAVGCSVPVVPRTVDNRYGGTFGGPILKNKLWFFGGTNWERTRNGASPSSSGSTLTPTPAGLAELQAKFPNAPAVAALSLAGPYAVKAGNPIPVSGTQVIKTVVGPGGVSDTNVEFAAVQRFVVSEYNDEEELGRLDWQPSERDHLFARYMYQNQINTNNGTAASIATGAFYDVPAITHSIGADWTHSFNASWSNQIRYSFQQSKVHFQGGSLAHCVSTNLTACTASVAISGGYARFGYSASFPQGRTVKVTQVQDNASWLHGKQTISFGGDFTYQNSPNVFLPNYNGSYSFGSFSSFLQGVGRLSMGDGNPVIPFTEPDYSLYLQDDYRIASYLTLNLGVRWEFFKQAVNLLHDETVKRETGSNPFWETTLPLAQRVYPLTNQNYKNFQPRIGFAFNPGSVKNLVVRGGFGINFDPSFYNMFLNSATAAPVINSGTITCNGGSVQCLPASGTSGAAVRALNLPLLPRGVNPNTRSLTNNTTTFKNPYTESYLLGVEYGIRNAGVLSASYVGSHTVGNFQSLNGNPYLLDIATAFPQRIAASSLCQSGGFDDGRLHCGQGNVITRANTAFNNYNALQLQLKTRSFHGLTTTTSYTYSRAINNADEAYSNGGGADAIAYAQNPLDTNTAERGVAAISFPHVASVAAVYELPFYKNQGGWIGKLLGGYTVSTAYDYNGGQPWSPFQFYSAAIGDRSALNSTSYCDPKFNGARIGNDVCRPVSANPKAPIGTVGIYVVDPGKNFTTAGTGYYAYGVTDQNGNLNQPTSPGNVRWLWNNQAYANLVGNPYPGVGRNTVRGQAYNNLDAAIVKTTKLREGVALLLYLNGFNVINHEFLGTPDSYIEDAGSSFGSTAYNTSNKRTFQLGGKVTF